MVETDLLVKTDKFSVAGQEHDINLCVCDEIPQMMLQLVLALRVKWQTTSNIIV